MDEDEKENQIQARLSSKKLMEASRVRDQAFLSYAEPDQ
jgi:hypothetical protein